MFIHTGCCHIKYRKWLQRSKIDHNVDDDVDEDDIDDAGDDDDDDDGTACLSPQTVT